MAEHMQRMGIGAALLNSHLRWSLGPNNWDMPWESISATEVQDRLATGENGYYEVCVY